MPLERRTSPIILVLLVFLFQSSCLGISQENKPGLYFAHAVNLYGTLLEAGAEKHISGHFPDWRVENPNHPRHQEGYRKKGGMEYFFKEVLPELKGCVAMPYLDGKWGLGVAAEAKWFLDRNMPVWVLESMGNFFRLKRITSIEASLIKNLDKSLVLSREETRLRTWKIYYKELRPYEEAHLVNLPVPKDFYSK